MVIIPKYYPALHPATLSPSGLDSRALAGNSQRLFFSFLFIFLSHGDSLAWSPQNVSTLSLSSRWWVATMPTPSFKTPIAFVVHIWRTHALMLYVSLLNPDEPLREGKCNINLVQKSW